MELIGTTYIQASTAYYASIEYSSRGWISGEKNHFKCLVRKNKDSKDNLYKIEGQWSGKSTIIDYKTKVSKPFLDINILKAAATKVKPLEKTGEMDTRRIWQKVSEAIRANDTAMAAKEKSIIENKKRIEKNERDEEGTQWEPVYFKWVEDEPDVTKLQNMLSKVAKYKGESNQNGNWVFREELKRTIK